MIIDLETFNRKGHEGRKEVLPKSLEMPRLMIENLPRMTLIQESRASLCYFGDL